MVQEELGDRRKLGGEACRFDKLCRRRSFRGYKFKKSDALSDFLNWHLLKRFSDTIELAEFSAGFRLFAAFLHAGFLVVFPALQFPFNTIDLQLFLQLANGVLKISTNFNFYHLGTPFYVVFGVFEWLIF